MGGSGHIDDLLLGDPENGDETTQLDDRRAFGGDVSRSWYLQLGSRSLELTAGADLRYDDVDNALLLSQLAVPFDTARRDSVELVGGGLFGQARLRLTDWMRLSAGLRVHGYDADVRSDLAINSGDISDELVLPKLSLSFGPWADTEIYVNYGKGMHSNDARGINAAVGPANPLVKSDGSEIGMRTWLTPTWNATAAFWWLCAPGSPAIPRRSIDATCRALRASRWIMQREQGCYDMQDVLGLR